jgi:hypothetical protein
MLRDFAPAIYILNLVDIRAAPAKLVSVSAKSKWIYFRQVRNFRFGNNSRIIQLKVSFTFRE